MQRFIRRILLYMYCILYIQYVLYIVYCICIYKARNIPRCLHVTQSNLPMFLYLSVCIFFFNLDWYLFSLTVLTVWSLAAELRYDQRPHPRTEELTRRRPAVCGGRPGWIIPYL